MKNKYQNKYRIESTRLQNWDYRWAASYFITICTKNREYYFGEISNSEMQLSAIGIIANILWYEIKNHVNNIELDAFVVMPNHIHGILILNNNDKNIKPDDNNIIPGGDNVETGHALSLLPHKPTIGQKRFQNIGKNSVSAIIGSYKSAITKHTNRLGYDFAWQTRFHDHIIRTDSEFTRIQQYIINNPKNWNNDKFNK